MSDIFVSYGAPDRGRAKLIADALSAQGWSVWWDRMISPGKEFGNVIEDALDSAKCVVVLWSNTSVASRWVRTEAAEAMRRNILVPVLVDSVKIPLEFSRLQSADLRQWQGDVASAELAGLINSIASLVADPPHTPLASSQSTASSSTARQIFLIRGSLSGRQRMTVIGAIAALGLSVMVLWGLRHAKSEPVLQTATAIGAPDVTAPHTGDPAPQSPSEGQPPRENAKPILRETESAGTESATAPRTGQSAAAAQTTTAHPVPNSRVFEGTWVGKWTRTSGPEKGSSGELTTEFMVRNGRLAVTHYNINVEEISFLGRVATLKNKYNDCRASQTFTISAVDNTRARSVYSVEKCNDPAHDHTGVIDYKKKP